MRYFIFILGLVIIIPLVLQAEVKDCIYCDTTGRVGCLYCNGAGFQECTSCYGTGVSQFQTCYHCDGLGRTYNEFFNRWELCSVCHGRGAPKCSVCKGRGVVKCYFCKGSGTTKCPYCKGRGYTKD